MILRPRGRDAGAQSHHRSLGAGQCHWICLRPPFATVRFTPARRRLIRRLRRSPGDGIDPPTSFDRLLHAGIGRFTMGLSPAALGLPMPTGRSISRPRPGKRSSSRRRASARLSGFRPTLARLPTAPDCPPCIEPLPQDHRFRGEAWQHSPFNADLPGVSPEPTMVAQRDDRHRRRFAASRASRRVRDAAAARHRLAGQFHRDQSRSSRDDVARRRAEPRPRRDEFLGGLGAGGGRQAAARRRSIPAGPERRRDQRRGGLPQPADRVDPVCADEPARLRPSRY